MGLLGELGDEEGGMWVVVESRDSGGFDVSCICLRYISGSLEGPRECRAPVLRKRRISGEEKELLVGS